MTSDNFSRTTITVPVDLKKRMKKMGSAINWSAVACEAFEARLEEIGVSDEEVTTIEGTIERLKQLKELEAGEQTSGADSGLEAGRGWAMNLATPEQLSRLENFAEEIGGDEWPAFLQSREGWMELTGRIVPGQEIESGRETESGRRMEARESSCGDGPSRRRRRRGQRHGRHRRHMRRHWRARQFWREILSERPREPDFFLGFANGALEIWRQVKDRLG